MFASDCIVLAASQQMSCNLAGEAVILCLKNGVYYGLNPVGARVWDLVQQPRTVGQILDTLNEEYAVDSNTCRQDLESLLQDLAAKGLVEIKPAD